MCDIPLLHHYNRFMAQGACAIPFFSKSRKGTAPRGKPQNVHSLAVYLFTAMLHSSRQKLYTARLQGGAFYTATMTKAIHF